MDNLRILLGMRVILNVQVKALRGVENGVCFDLMGVRQRYGVGIRGLGLELCRGMTLGVCLGE